MPDHMVNEDFIIKPEGKLYIQPPHILEASNYAFIYLIILFFGVSVMTAHGYSVQDSLFEFASSIGTVGLSIGITSATTPPVVLWAQIVGMLFGRLEVYVILIAGIKLFKDLKNLFIKI